MKRTALSIIFILSLFSIQSCKKQRHYHIQGTLLNEVTGTGHNMGGETVQLLRIRTQATFDIFGNPDKVTKEAEAITNDEGRFDFGIQKLKEGEYRIDYVYGERNKYYGVSNSFVDITLDRNTAVDEKISIIPAIYALNFIADPLFTNSTLDTIFVQFYNETRHKYDSTIYNGSFATGYDLKNYRKLIFGGIGGEEYMGRFFIKITKSYSGFRTIVQDTIFVEKDEFYNYRSSF